MGEIATWLSWAAASRPLAGQIECGDACLVHPRSDGALLAVVDGLGHGREAAQSAELACSVLMQYANDPILELFRRCNDSLVAERGAAMSIATIDQAAATLTWAGVGNVDGVLVHAPLFGGAKREHVLMRGGVVGYRMPPVRTTTLPLAPGDRIVLATDGIDSHFAESTLLHGAPQETADWILDHHGKRSDDALVLVAYYRAG
jgi:serine/threonine protein phosphatase PrpC